MEGSSVLRETKAKVGKKIEEGKKMSNEEVLAYKELENLLVKLEASGYQCSFHTDLPKRLMVFNVVAKEKDMIYLGERIGVTKHDSTGMTLEDWTALSRRGEVCGILGCKNKPIVRCPHCGNHYCSQHSFVIDTPAHPRKK